MFTLCADGYLDIEADVAFAASTNLMPRGKDILFLGKVLGKIHRDSATFDDDSWNAQIEQFPPRTKGCSALLAVHSSVSVAAKVEKAERVRAPLSASPDRFVHYLYEFSAPSRRKFGDGFIGFLSAVVSENGFVLVSGSERNTFVGLMRDRKNLRWNPLW